MRNFMKPVVLVALAASMMVGADAQSLRKFGNLNLNYNQKQQMRQILNSGDRRDPATRARMQQQIMNVLTPQQQNQLAWELQQRNGNQNYNVTYPNNNGYYNNGYNNGYNTYNNGYYNNGYNNGYYNNGNYNYNQSTMQSLINSGIVNGVLQSLIR